MSVLNPPSFRMQLGEVDFQNPSFNPLVIKIEVECNADGPDKFVVTLNDSHDDFMSKHRGKIREGGSAKIKLGYTGGPYQEVMDGTITKIEAKRVSRETKMFIVTGFDYMHYLTRGEHSRAWRDVKDSDIVSTLASEAGLGAECDDSGIKHEYIMQDTMNNLQFLYERAARCGFEVDVIGKTLSFKRPKPKDSICDLIWDHNNFLRSNSKHVLVTNCNFETSTMGQIKKVIVRHYDPNTSETIEGISEAVVGTAMGGQQTGGQAAAESANDEQTTKIITDHPVRSVEEAEKLAWAILNRISGMFVKCTGECEGDGRIKPGEIVKMDAFGESMDGPYYVTESKHIMDFAEGGVGYVTEFGGRRSGH